MFKWQVGQFFIFLALIVLIVFFITNQVDSPELLYLCSGFFLLVLGAYLMWSGRNPTRTSSERFRTIRRISRKGQNDIEDQPNEE